MQLDTAATVDSLLETIRKTEGRALDVTVLITRPGGRWLQV